MMVTARRAFFAVGWYKPTSAIRTSFLRSLVGALYTPHKHTFPLLARILEVNSKPRSGSLQMPSDGLQLRIAVYYAAIRLRRAGFCKKVQWLHVPCAFIKKCRHMQILLAISKYHKQELMCSACLKKGADPRVRRKHFVRNPS